MTRFLIIFARLDAAGRVKTRLGRKIGFVRAAMLYRHLLKILILRLADRRRWRLVLALTPEKAPLVLPAKRHIAFCIQQGKGDLGARMGRVFTHLPPGEAIIIGSDIPDITPSHIANGFALLGRHRVVMGPCMDGGYWLIGQRRRPKIIKLFRAIRWSAQETRADTLSNLGVGEKCGFLAALADLDEEGDYRAWLATGGRIAP